MKTIATTTINASDAGAIIITVLAITTIITGAMFLSFMAWLKRQTTD